MSYNFSPHGYARAHADYCMSAYRVLLRRADYDDVDVVPVGLRVCAIHCSSFGCYWFDAGVYDAALLHDWSEDMNATYTLLYFLILCECVSIARHHPKSTQFLICLKILKCGMIWNWSRDLFWICFIKSDLLACICEWRRWVGAEGERHTARVKLNCYIANMYAVKSICDATHSRRHIDFGKKKFNFVKNCSSTRRHSARFGNNLVQWPKL